jgi:dGTPase
MSMSWSRLFSADRLGAAQRAEGIGRGAYERDFDRILFSTPFRRLQDKTQVFPMPANDHIHNRLIHSMEVASVGRSLGKRVGERLRPRPGWPELHPSEVGDIVASAALMHDIGNPAFGHAGEDAIASWFVSNPWATAELDAAERADLEHFEGNAQSFRLVASLDMYAGRGGMQLTLATLGAAAKYPQGSLFRKAHWQGGPHVARKKFNYVSADRAAFAEVAEGLGLLSFEDGSWARHPFAYLVEAADDLCYGILDLEDGFTLGYVDADEIIGLFEAVIGTSVERRHKADREQVGYLRARAISVVVAQVAEAFAQAEEALLAGALRQPLTANIQASDALAEISLVTRQRCYQAAEVLRIELAGYKVLGGLLDILVPAVQAADPRGPQGRARQLLPQPLPASPYLRLLAVTDFLSAMTDRAALSLFRELHGIDVPGVRGIAS